MPGREIEVDSHPARVVFRSPRNWTGVCFFGALGLLHLGMATTALMAHQFEAHMSVVFGGLFLGFALGCLLVRREILMQPQQRRFVVRTGVSRLAARRAMPFSSVLSVRVTLLGRNYGESSVSIVCKEDEIELPPSRTPRQQGLLLAMMMEVRLVKVYGDGPPPEPAERIARLFRNEDAV
jgi:hypothetical protein